MAITSRPEVAGDAQMPAHNLGEHWIALGRPDGSKVSDHPQRDPDDPEPQAEPEGRGQRAVQDGD
jgi:hypothetical protein